MGLKVVRAYKAHVVNLVAQGNLVKRDLQVLLAVMEFLVKRVCRDSLVLQALKDSQGLEVHLE